MFPFSTSLLSILASFTSLSTPALFYPSFFHVTLFSPLVYNISLSYKSPSPPSSPYSTHLTAQPFLSAPFSFCISILCPPFSSSSLPQVAALQEEKSSLLAENQVLMERLNQSDSIEDINSPAGRRHLQLQTQLEQLQEETFRYSAAKRRGILPCK